jgi:hypothetical protein
MPNTQKGGRGAVGSGYSLDKSRYYYLYYQNYKHKYKEYYINKIKKEQQDSTDYRQQFINFGFLIIK